MNCLEASSQGIELESSLKIRGKLRRIKPTVREPSSEKNIWWGKVNKGIDFSWSLS